MYYLKVACDKVRAIGCLPASRAYEILIQLLQDSKKKLKEEDKILRLRSMTNLLKNNKPVIDLVLIS